METAAPATTTRKRGIIAVSSLTASPERQAGLEAAFRSRQKLVDGFDGFRRLQLAKVRGSGEYLLFLEWDDMDAFRAYVQSPAFHHAHPESGDGVQPGPLRIFDVLLDSKEGD